MVAIAAAAALGFLGDLHRLDPDALPLTRDQADWIFERMVEAGQVADEPELRQRARAVYGAELGSEEP